MGILYHLVVLAENVPEDQKTDGSPWMSLMPIVLMIFIFYLLLIRPQRKMQRQKQEMLKMLKKHDQVVTRGGVIGTIIEVRPDKEEVLVEIAKGTRVRVRRGAIEGVFTQEESDAKGDRK